MLWALQMHHFCPFKIFKVVFASVSSYTVAVKKLSCYSQPTQQSHVRVHGLCYPPQLACVNGPKVCCQVRDDHLTQSEAGRKVKSPSEPVHEGSQVINLNVAMNG